MEVKLVSDLHLEMCKSEDDIPILGSGDVLILGGDILCARHFKSNGELSTFYKKFLDTCSKNFTHILYVLGNHEAYGYNYEGTFKVIRDNVPDNCTVLENESKTIGDWTFLGCTFWTNFRNANPIEMFDAQQCMSDYNTIRITPKYRKLNPDDTLQFNTKSKDYLLNTLKGLEDDNVWILTHHAPSNQSIHENYKHSGILNGAYVNNLDGMIMAHPQIKVWSHGHVHNNFDYMIDGCRVVCNPRGYVPFEVNPNFDCDFTVRI
jgi:Icc-related predicted phosphoesterase